MRKVLTAAVVLALLTLAAVSAVQMIGVQRPKMLFIDMWTPGGVIPMALIDVGGDSAYISSGGRASRPESNLTERDGDFEIHKFDLKAGTVIIEFLPFGSVLELSVAEGEKNRLEPGDWAGVWRKQRSSGEDAEVPVQASRSFPGTWYEEILDLDKPNSDFTGRWSVSFSSSDDLAIGIFEVHNDQLATGTFLTTTGDYRYLAGRVDGDLMRLSTFDGAHAFLFHARMQPDGTIAGDFWSGNWWHETWTATRDPDAQLPDMFARTTVADADALDDLTFKALDGTPTRVADLLDATDAPARVLYVFGTWCPNCADAAAELKRLKDLHGDNLGVVGLAFELTDDHERSATQVNRYLERHGGTWPILIAGLSDKSKASAELPILDKVRSYPTTIFLNADNEIVSIHTGFTGPATGEAFSEQQREYERIINELISEQP